MPRDAKKEERWLGVRIIRRRRKPKSGKPDQASLEDKPAGVPEDNGSGSKSPKAAKAKKDGGQRNSKGKGKAKGAKKKAKSKTRRRAKRKLTESEARMAAARRKARRKALGREQAASKSPRVRQLETDGGQGAGRRQPSTQGGSPGRKDSSDRGRSTPTSVLVQPTAHLPDRKTSKRRPHIPDARRPLPNWAPHHSLLALGRAVQPGASTTWSRPPRPTRSSGSYRRNYQIGLDWGTSASKVVVRDLDAPGQINGNGVCWPLLFGGSPRYPSTVAISDGKLWFGFEAERRRGYAQEVWDSLKSSVAVGNKWTDKAAGGLILQDLVALSLSHLRALARDEIERHAREVRATPKVRATVGFPTKEVLTSLNCYSRCMVVAHVFDEELQLDPQGIPVADLAQILWETKERVDSLYERTTAQPALQVRPESVAGVLWFYQLPQVGEGPYYVVDVGASTVHATFFRVHHSHTGTGALVQKGGLSIEGVETRAVGMNCIGKRLQALGAPSVAHVRGRERDLCEIGDLRRDLEPELDAMRRTWAKADQLATANRMVSGAGSKRELLQSLILGGGGQVAAVAKQFDPRSPRIGSQVGQARRLRGGVVPGDFHPNGPPDLRRRNRAANPSALQPFVMVAYGLSFPAGSTPDYRLAIEGSKKQGPLPIKPFTSHEDLYGDG